MNEILKIKRELEQLKSGLKCLLSLFPAATQWTPEHTTANNYKYSEGTLVWHQGCIYKCKKDNSGADIQNEYFWEKIGFGFLLAQEQADWNATEGPSYIRNKPWNVGGEEQDPVFTEWLNSNPLSSYLTFSEASDSFYPLNSNPSGYLTPASAGLLYYPLNSNPSGYLTSAALLGYATQTWVGDNFYPLNSNPSGYLTQQRVEEYPDFASFPLTGEEEVIYIDANTGLFYSWNGTGYDPSSAPNTGITGGGIINRLPKFTPNGTTLGSSNFSDNGSSGKYNQGTSYVEFIPGSNIWLRLQRATTNRMDFLLGNPGLGQAAEVTTNNTLGLEFKATGTSAYISLKAGASSLEGLRVLSTGKLQFTQTPDTGTTTDAILVRDSSGNIKIVAYPTIPSTSTLVPYTGATANVNLGTYGLLAEYLEVNTTPTTYTPAVGRLGWNDTDGTFEFKLKGGNVTLQIGQEQVIRVINKTTPLIDLLEANYQVCVVSGATGQRVSVRLAQADSDANSAGTLGMVTEDINANQEGFITTSGQVREINTTGSLQGETWSDGDILYLSPITAGAITNVKPTAPYHTVIVGYVEYAHAIHGKIYVKIDNGYELDELHNVKITSPQNNDVLMYNSTLGLWDNENPFSYFDAKSVTYQKHINMPIIGNAGVNNVEGVSFVVGGGTARAWTGTNLVTKTQRLGLVTATTGNLAQIRQINNYITREDGFSAISGFNMAENATDSTVRFFIGFSTLSIFSNVEANTLINCTGFCKLTTSNNVNIVHNDNTGTATTIDLGSNFPANTISTDKYFLYWETVPTGIYLKIVRLGTIHSYETILTTDIPATTTALNFGAYIVDSTGPSVNTGADWYGTYIRILS